MPAFSEKADIMAIGDSLYQGVRSLSFTPSMAQHSMPAMVARAIGMSVTVPDLRHPLLWDLEEQIRHGGLLRLLGRIRTACIENLVHWPLDQPWSEHEAFDNIAIGSSEIGSLLENTHDLHFERLPGLIDRLNDPSLELSDLAGTIASLWFSLNNCYTLNPRHRREQGRKSALDQVEDRQPRILLINIGSNEGLSQAGFLGDMSDETMANLARVPRLLEPIADRLARLPSRTERIVFNNLVRPRSIPNLMPSPERENDFPGEGYYAAYGPRISSTQQGISGEELQAFDEQVKQINAEAEDVLRSAVGDWLVIADVYDAGTQLDGKHFFRRGLDTAPAGPKLDNRPLTPLLFGQFHGGLTGLDNLHPTTPGYAAIADTVLAALGRPDLRTDKSAAFQADTLLNDFNGLFVIVAQAELSLLGTAMGSRQSRESAIVVA